LLPATGEEQANVPEEHCRLDSTIVLVADEVVVWVRLVV
jgi:hypothetical protein